MDETSTEPAEPKKRRISCLRLIVIFVLLLTLAAVYVACIYTPPLRISVETTRITGPLTADGQIDFLRYLEETRYPPELATDENGFRIFLRTFGDIAEKIPFNTEQKYKKLGLDIKVPPTMVFPKSPDVVVYEYYKKLGEQCDEKYEMYYRTTWTLEDYPMLTDWITDAEAPLNAAAEMIRKPVFFFPYLQDEESHRTGKPQNLLTLLLPDVQMVRSIARCYSARARYRIAAGNIDGTIDDAITIHLLGRKVGQDGMLVQVLVGIAIEGIALAVPVDANPDHQPTKEQLQRLLDAVNYLPPRQPIENAFEFERAIALSVLQDICREDGINDLNNLLPAHSAINMIMNAGVKGANQNVAFRYINEGYDTITGKRPRSELASYYKSPFSTIDDAWLLPTPGGRGKLLGRIMCSLLIPAVDAAEEAVRRTECCYNMKRLTLALLLYKTEHGEFPKADWIEKIKPYLGDDFEQHLRCPSCLSGKEGETNYALILYDKLPEDRDTLLLIELNTSVSHSEAVIPADDVLREITKKIGSSHPYGINTAQQNGAILFLTETVLREELQRQLGQTEK